MKAIISKPEAGQTQEIQGNASHYVFEFGDNPVSMARDGDDLVFDFGDSKVVLKDYYTENSGCVDAIYEMDGEQFSSGTFFAMLEQIDLAPAMGQQLSPSRYHQFDHLNLAEGVNHLWGLDYGFELAHPERGARFNEGLYGESGVDTLALASTLERPDPLQSRLESASAPLASAQRPAFQQVAWADPAPQAPSWHPAAPAGPETPAISEPLAPVTPPAAPAPETPPAISENPVVQPSVPEPPAETPAEPEAPSAPALPPEPVVAEKIVVPAPPDMLEAKPDNPRNLPEDVAFPDGAPTQDSLAAAREILAVDEKDLQAGAADSAAIIIKTGSNVTEIKVGDTIILKDGRIIPGVEVATDEGRLVDFALQGGRLFSKFVLDRASSEHAQPGRDTIAHDLIVSVKNAGGMTATTTLTVVVKDDVPTLEITGGSAEIKAGATATGSIDASFGADSGPGASWQAVDGAGNRTVLGSPDGDNVIIGQHGSLNISADGAWTYKANPNASGTERFTFEMRDADGDVVNSGNYAEMGMKSAPEIIIEIKSVESPILPAKELDESFLRDGNPDIPVDLDGYEILEVIEPGEKGTLVKDGDQWSYRPDNGPENHPDPGKDKLPDYDTVKIKVRDEDGNEFIVEQKFDLVDDVPEVKVDEDEKTAWTGGDGIEGKIDITIGADDGPEKEITLIVNGKEEKPGEIPGKHGTLVIDEDGGWTYRADPQDEDFTGGDEEFTIRVKDADCDEATGTVTIHVRKPEGPTAGNLPVDESGLKDGTATATVEIPGYRIVQVLPGDGREHGSLEQVGGDWVYTLSENLDHKDGNSETYKDADSYTLIVEDENGNRYRVIQKFDVIDDTPSVGDGTGSVVSGASITGDPIAIDFGADDKEGKSVTVNGQPLGSVHGQHGTLTLNESGSWTYAADPKDETVPNGAKFTDTFTVKVTDSDGDEREGTITVNISKPSPATFPREVDEQFLADGGARVNLAVDGYTIIGAEDGANGTVAQIGDEWVYTLIHNLDHDKPDHDLKLEGGDSVRLKVQDSLGNTYIVEQRIDVIDDVPTAEMENGEQTVVAGKTATGKLIADFGADDGAAKKITVDGNDLVYGQEIAGAYGKLVVSESGEWTYTANAIADGAQGGKDEFTFKVIDSDGDEAETDSVGNPLKISIAVKPANRIIANEANIKDGTPVDVIVDDEYEIIGVEQQGEKGKVVENPDGTWSYVLETPHDHTQPGNDTAPGADTVVLKVRDKEGNETTITQKVDIIDDTPQAVGDDEGETVSGDPAGISGKVTIDFGADDKEGKSVTVNGEPAGEIQGEHGKLTIDEDGNWTYLADPKDETHLPGSEFTETFTVKVKDSDGDEQEGTITVKVVKPAGPVLPNSEVREEDLADGNAKVAVTLEDYTIIGVVENGSIGAIAQDGTDWIYTLNDNIDHGAPGSSTDLKITGADTLQLKVQDAFGNTYIVEKKIDVVDDAPSASMEHGDQIVYAGKAATGKLIADFGADDGAGKKITVDGNDMTYGQEIAGTWGKLIVQENGEWTYTANELADGSQGGRDEFAFQVIDSDGDVASADSSGNPLKISIEVRPANRIVANEADIKDGTPVDVVVDDEYEIIGVEQQGEKGKVVENPDGTWSYILETPHNHDKPGSDTAPGADVVVLKVRDKEGNETTITQKVDIIDDTPKAVGDDDGETVSGDPAGISGKVTIDFGADNGPAKEITINGDPIGEIQGEHGKLTLYENGNWTYKADPKDENVAPGSEFEDVFTVKVKDADGDEQAGTITVKIVKPDGPVMPSSEVREEDLAADNAKVNVALENYTILGVVENGSIGTVAQDGSDWVYTLGGNIDHGAPGSSTDQKIIGADTVKLKVQDEFGNTYVVEKKIDVIDDAPSASMANGTQAIGGGATATGALVPDFGADDGAAKKITVNGKDLVYGQEIAGTYGKLVVNESNEWTYVANALAANQNGGRDEFSFAVIDSDGDKATVDASGNPLKVVIDVVKAGGPEDGRITADEAGIAFHNTVDVLVDGYTITGVATQGGKGTVVVNEHGTCTYELTKNHAHESGDGCNTAENADSFVLKVKDANGNEYLVAQQVDIIDDIPDLTVTGGGKTQPGGTVTGFMDHDFGADGAGRLVITVDGHETVYVADQKNVISGRHGTLTIEDMAWTYVANEDASGRDEFLFSITDSDGDTVNSMAGAEGEPDAPISIVIDVEKPVVIPPKPVKLDVLDDHLVVDEKDMAAGEAKAGIVVRDKDGNVYTIVEVVEDGYFGSVVQENGEWVYVLNKAYAHESESQNVISGDMNISVSESAAIHLADRDTAANADFVRLRVQDAEGNTYIVNRKVDIIDDIPDLELSERNLGDVIAGAEAATTGRIDYDFGADKGDGAKIIATVNGKETVIEIGKENVIDGEHGRLILDADGSYRYLADTAGQDKFSFRIVDADGDSVMSDTAGSSFAVSVNVLEKIEPENGEITVNERDMRDGGSATADLIVDGFEVIAAETDGSKGTAALVNGKWVYTLKDTVTHALQGVDTANGVDTVSLRVKDAAGNEYTVHKVVNVIDDIPEIAVTGGGTARGGETVSGALDLQYGADGAGTTVVIFDGRETLVADGAVVNGKYGDLAFENGGWTYTANSDGKFGRDNFRFKITDADGDVVDSDAGTGVLIGEKKPFEIDINVLPDNVDVYPSIIYEQELVFGSINLDVAVDGWTIVSATPQGHAGAMVRNEDGSWRYVLDKALSHTDGVNITDSVRLELRNGEYTVTVDKRIDIVDDKPRLSIAEADIPVAQGIVVCERDLLTEAGAKAVLSGDATRFSACSRTGIMALSKKKMGSGYIP